MTPLDMYHVPCPDCGEVFACEFMMLTHQTMDHLPQPRAFVTAALNPLGG